MPKNFFTGVSTPKSTMGAVWPFSIQKHDAERAGTHYDLRLGTQGLSWAIRNWPKPGERVLAKQTVDHHPSYYSFEGVIPKGYGKGKVTLIDHGVTEVLKATPDKISFIQRDRYLPKRYTLVRTLDKNWLLINHTPAPRLRQEIPTVKTKYKTITNLEKHLTDGKYILSPKYDGAANVVVLRKNKHPEAFSHRPGKQGLIDHTFKLNFDKYVSKTQTQKPTVLWAETLLMGGSKPKPVQDTAGALNALLERTRYQRGHFKNIVYNIDTYEGKDVSKAPYEKKMALLADVVKRNPYLDLPVYATTSKSKKKLLNAIQTGKYPHTREGIIAFDRTKPYPDKYKLENDFTVYIRGVVPGKGKFTKSMGGLQFSYTKDGPIAGVIGGGFTEADRQAIYDNPSSYVGKRAIVKANDQYASGTLRAPIFVQWVGTGWVSK